ncbi:MAG: UvrD-helicase domain-containing protein, partial [Clostridia bacterium]|nr:UvrD-helicase domain-containing protein [Clostridia bacterium]
MLRYLNSDDVKRMTPQQKESVLSDGKIIVSASAGSGKTTTMVLKILSLIAEGHTLDSMLIVVYNDAAAAELKEKLYNKLCERIEDSNISEEIRERFVKAVIGIELCNISTIHAFCRKYAKTNFEALGISPQFDILDAQKEAKLMDTALNNVFSSYDENDEVFSDILEIFSKQRKDDNLKGNILSLYRMINIQPDGGKSFKENISKCYDVPFKDSYFYTYIYNSFISAFKNTSSMLNEVLMQINMTAQEKYKSYVPLWISICDEALKCSNFSELMNWASMFTSPGTAPRTDTKTENAAEEALIIKNFVSIRDAFVEREKELAEFADKKEYLDKAHEQNGIYVHKLVEIVDKFKNEYKALKDAENKYTFDDLLHFVIDIINSKGDEKEKFDFVFVDEYQDVTPLTAFITSSFMNENSYIVGDVKQSIYGFNLADPQLFLDTREEYATNGGHAIDFNRNFRSKSSILSFVNSVFDIVMTKENSGIDYAADSRFEIDDQTEKGGLVDITLIRNTSSDEEPEYSGVYDIDEDIVDVNVSGSSSYIEGQFIADKIRHLINDDEYINDGKGGLRRIKYSDIAILLRSRNVSTERIIQALKDSGIPLDESTFTNNNDNPERELINLLRVIDNPRQENYFAGYLLSFFGGYSEEEVLRIAGNYHGNTIYDKFLNASRSSDEIAIKAKKTLDKLNEYRTKASFKNVADLMSGIISDYAYDAYLYRNGQNNVDELKQFIISKSDRKGSSLSEFINDYSDDEDITSIPDNVDSVKISTFHGFKGLEVPIVFISNISQQFNKNDLKRDLLFNESGFTGIKYFDFESKTRYNTVSYYCIKDIIN